MKKTFLPVVLLLLGILGNAKEQSYQIGTLADVSDLRLDAGTSLGSIRLCCIFQIRADGFVYSVGITKRPEEVGWAVNSPIQFRVDKHTVFLKRAKGRELRAKLLKVVPLVPSSSAAARASNTGSPLELPPPLPGPSKFNPVVPMALDLLNDMYNCVLLSANLSSGDFFREFSSKTTKKGRQFRNYSGRVDMFPERLTIAIRISLLPCVHTEEAYENAGRVQPRFIFNKQFFESLTFQGFWKQGFDMKKADLEVLAGSETCSGQPLGTESACSWQYELNVWSREVPLNDVMVVQILSADGRLVTRFSSRNLMTK